MNFTEYYKHYLTLHQNKWCRRLHVLGQITTILYVGTILYNGIWLGLMLAPFIVYPFAWSGHVLFEKNKPAALSHPLWAKACDWIMLRDIITGKVEW